MNAHQYMLVNWNDDDRRAWLAAYHRAREIAAERDARLEYLRAQIRGECISYGEIAELQGFAASIDPDDVELLEWAGVPEQMDDRAVWFAEQGMDARLECTAYEVGRHSVHVDRMGGE